VDTDKEGHTLDGHAGFVRGVAWSPDGKRLVSVADGEHTFRVWNAATGKLLKSFPVANWAHTGAVAWSPDNKAVALGFIQGPHGVFDPETGRQIRAFDAGHMVYALAWSPDGTQAATVGTHGVRLQAASGKQGRPPAVLEDTCPLIRSLTWSPDSTALALSLSYNNALRVEAATGRRQARLPIEGLISGSWSPDGKTFATVGETNDVQLWDVTTRRLVRALEGKCSGVLIAWSADGKLLASGENEVRVWSAATGKVLWQSDKLQGLRNIAWSPDGRLATTDITGVRLWKGEDGKLLREVPLKDAWRLAWSPDGKTLAAAAPVGVFLLIDAESGKVRARLQSGHFWCPHWAADSKTLVTYDFQGGIRTWDPASGKQRRAVPCGLPFAPPNQDWSPDGRVLAGAIGSGVYLCDSDGRPLGALLPSDPYQRLALTADGHYSGSPAVERVIRMVVQKSDGTSETLTADDFARKYGFKNDPDKVRLTGGSTAK
jgi:WD40 repeat protein